MALKEFEQPEIIDINDSLRLRKYDGQYELFLPGYQNPVVYQNSEGIFDESRIPDLDYVKGMCNYLAKVGELYYIEVKESGRYIPIGDVTVKDENPPIAIWVEECRGKGIGKLVMQTVISRLKELGFAKITGSTVYKWNIPSQKMHEQLGFRQIAEDEKEIIYELQFGESNVGLRRNFMKLETDRLILRRWSETDAESLFEYARDPDVGPVAGWPPHKDKAESLDVIRNVLTGVECYAICEKGSGKAIGSIELKLNGHTDMTDKDDECELGYWIGKPFWGRGYMPEAVTELLRHGFETLGMTTIWCGYYDGNDKSKRVQEKVGFLYHHTCNEVPVPLMHEIRVGHTNYMTRKRWEQLNLEEQQQID